MTKEELVTQLQGLIGEDAEAGHLKADHWLLTYIHEPDVTAAFEALERWYA